MATEKYYVIGDDNCKYEAMTKEEILNAIEMALAGQDIIDEANKTSCVITKIKELNKGKSLTFWVGSQAEYNAITEKAEDCFYIISNSEKIAMIENSINELIQKQNLLDEKIVADEQNTKNKINELNNKINSLNDALYYKNGQTVNLSNMIFSGIIYSGATTQDPRRVIISFDIPMDKSLKNVTNIQFTKLNVAIRRCDGGAYNNYKDNNAQGTPMSTDMLTVSKRGERHIRVLEATVFNPNMSEDLFNSLVGTLSAPISVQIYSATVKFTA